MDETTKGALYKKKSDLTPEELNKRRSINKKIFLFFILPIAAIFLIIILIPDSKPAPISAEKRAQDSILAIKQLAALVTAIRNDTLEEIKEVFYNPKNGSLNIGITNKYNSIKDKLYSGDPTYFYDTYHLGTVAKIEGVYIYEYKKGKSFEKGDYSKPLAYLSKNLGAKLEAFKAKYYDNYLKTYRPLNDYLKEHLNDPGSLDIDKSFCEMNEDGTFHCKTVFRAKNGFGALVVQTADCDIDNEGTLSNVALNK